MIKIIVNGCQGKMGAILTKVIEESDAAELADGIDESCGKDFSSCVQEADAVIDFSHPSCLPSLLSFCTQRRLPLVIATTGFRETEEEQIKKAAELIPVFRSANMSLGINVLARLAKLAAVNLEDDFNIEIIEKHHNKKVDSPSGTAFLLADAVNSGCRAKKNLIFGRHGHADECRITDMGIHAIRGGSIPGDHTILFAGPGETIEITHRALTKEIFAEGALKAAAWLVGKEPDLYSMKDLLS